MQPLNPLLQAFFRSSLPAQCTPLSHHILLIPPTDFLLSYQDADTHTPYTELVKSEEFIASHIIRTPQNGGSGVVRDGVTMRDLKGKARQFTTFNGRGVAVKDATIYGNTGFKKLTQAQLVNDTLYYPDSLETQQWLVYFISRPLIGTPEPLDGYSKMPLRRISNTTADAAEASSARGPEERVNTFTKGDSLDILLSAAPAFARAVQPKFEQLYRDFNTTLERTSQLVDALSDSGSTEDLAEDLQVGSEAQLTEAYEVLVLSALELFQVEEIALIRAQIDSDGGNVDRMVERHVAQHVHEALFPRVCALRVMEDSELEYNLKQMSNIDVSQVGVDFGANLRHRRELSLRLARAGVIFKKMNTCTSAQEMIDVVLETEQCVAASLETDQQGENANSEKLSAVVNANADTLVAELLVVLIRSPVQSLLSRLWYMQRFSLADDVESGEIGYALSTFEAVVTYLSNDSAGLKKASRANHALWQAVKKGNLTGVRSILTPEDVDHDDTAQRVPHRLSLSAPISESDDDSSQYSNPRRSRSNKRSSENVVKKGPRNSSQRSSKKHSRASSRQGPGLSHVFPFQAINSLADLEAPLKKRVSMRSLSISSSISGHSITSHGSTLISADFGVASDTNAEHLAHTCNGLGSTIMMMTVERGQPEILRFLLDLPKFFPAEQVIADRNNAGTTLFSAAIQGANAAIIKMLHEYLWEHIDTDDEFSNYFKIQDANGRSAAHYLFNAPWLLLDIGDFAPWTQRDNNGQTPLFALCRSYDHEKYRWMVEFGLELAQQAQPDGGRLHLDDHVDRKGNTLLHIVHDQKILQWLLYHCDSNPNAVNDKKFTPLMVASKYGRIDSVRVIFGDARTDFIARDQRGMTAVELAKDDEVRNRIDDMMLLAVHPSLKDRVTSVVRSFFVEDGTVRLVVKSAARNQGSHSITVTTCRRGTQEFENLARWLSTELPASWIPSVHSLRLPFQFPSRPSRALLRDIQLRLDGFLRVLLAHATFGTHEMLWEFFLVPDMSPDTLAERSKRKAELRVEKLREEFSPITETTDVETFIGHAREQVRTVHWATRTVFRRLNALNQASVDLADIHGLVAAQSRVLSPDVIPGSHALALTRLVACYRNLEYSPLVQLHYQLSMQISCTTALLHALNRPTNIVAQMRAAEKTLGRLAQSAQRTSVWPAALGLLDDTRTRLQQGAQDKKRKANAELHLLGCELRYTQGTVATELAGWQDARAKTLKRGLREWAKRTLVVERERLAGMRRAVRALKVASEAPARAT